ncbi:peptidase inhibitor family I36 protein [Kitasatospora sp. NPDC004669]|uniref:peptidase inhibitor family I36 protein n=1 Tax=Kitasatospora sp. NPDC004669 TaxID=3154555 RepID=UPI0033B178B9
MGAPVRHRLLRAALASAAALGLAAVTAPAVHADPAATGCPRGYFCLFEGPHQSGRVLLAENAHITKDGFQLRELDGIEPPIFPRSARNPLPDGAGCIVRLNDRPHFAGDEQEVVGFGNHELDGRRVGSLTPDCG